MRRHNEACDSPQMSDGVARSSTSRGAEIAAVEVTFCMVLEEVLPEYSDSATASTTREAD